MREGCCDAHIQSLRDGLKAIKSKIGNQDSKNIEKLESYIEEIEKGINVENSYDRQIEDLLAWCNLYQTILPMDQ